MENISFVLWVVLYPLSSAITHYLGSKRRKLNGEKPYKDSIVATASLIDLLVWVVIGSNLYN